MISYLILCRSLTYAQRTVAILGKSGIRGYINRTPRALGIDGCGYCVKIGERWLGDALKILKQNDLPPRRVLLVRGEDVVEEADL